MKGLSDFFPNGASSKQRDNFRKGLMKNRRLDIAYREWTVEEKCLDSELSALSMLDSCFAYGGVDGFFKPKGYGDNEVYYDTYLKRYLKEGGSKKEFDKMLEIQKKHLERCSVKWCTYTDSEGCSYNSIVDYDEEIA